MNNSVTINFLTNRIIDQMTVFLMEDFSLELPEALRIIYSSEVFSIVNDDSNGLYIQSPSYVYELMKKEYLTGKF